MSNLEKPKKDQFKKFEKFAILQIPKMSNFENHWNFIKSQFYKSDIFRVFK